MKNIGSYTDFENDVFINVMLDEENGSVFIVKNNSNNGVMVVNADREVSFISDDDFFLELYGFHDNRHLECPIERAAQEEFSLKIAALEADSDMALLFHSYGDSDYE